MIRSGASRARRRQHDPLDPLAAGRTVRVRWGRVAAVAALVLGAVWLLRPGEPERVPRLADPAPQVAVTPVAAVVPIDVPAELTAALAQTRWRCSQGDHDGALDVITRAVDLDDGADLDRTTELRLQRAFELDHAGFPERAVDEYRQALRAGGWVADAPAVWVRLARLENELAYSAEAVAAATRALEAQPFLGTAWAERAQGLLDLGLLDKAEEAAGHARTHAPQAWRTWVTSARVRMARGEQAQAARDLARARDLAPSGAEAEFALDAAEVELLPDDVARWRTWDR